MKPYYLDLEGTPVPHWALQPEDNWPLFESFVDFAEAVWRHLGLPKLTKAQRHICHRLQYGPSGNQEAPRHDIIRAFRGVGKSYITAAFVLWRLMRNPRDEKVLVVSATGGKSSAFVSMVKNLLLTMAVLEFLRPTDDQRNKADRFDVRGASISQSFSLRAASITGQVTGDRSTLIVPDDIEIPTNSMTEEARAKLFNLSAEFEAILVPGGDVIYLGTPQTEESVYNRLVKERNYACFTIPSRYPRADKLPGYTLKRNGGEELVILAGYILEDIAEGRAFEWQPTDPERFDNAYLNAMEAKGRAYFALQYQLDTSLSDAERYPLKTVDLIVLQCHAELAPRLVSWGHATDNKNYINDIPNLGFTGDRMLRPLFLSEEWRKYEGACLFVDPSGRGKDETAWAIVKSLNGVLYLVHVNGIAGNPDAAMKQIAKDAKAFNVNTIEVEPNFGQGIWISAFQPILTKEWPGGCTVKEAEWSKGQKELRILDVLEPVISSHRLVISEDLARRDASAEDPTFSLLYQLTHITRERGALQHDDRVEAVSGAVYHFVRALAQDSQETAEAQEIAERHAFIDEWFYALDDGEAFRGVLRNGVRMMSVRIDSDGRKLLYNGSEDSYL